MVGERILPQATLPNPNMAQVMHMTSFAISIPNCGLELEQKLHPERTMTVARPYMSRAA